MSSEKFYGVYAGICVDVADPESRSRIRLKVRQVLGDSITNWAEACLPVTSNTTHDAHVSTVTSSSNGAHSHSDPQGGSTSTDGTHTHTVSINLSHTPHNKTPRLNQTVWVMFIGGDPNFPIWIGVAP